MPGAITIARACAVMALTGVTLAACGSTRHASRSAPVAADQLRSFELMQAGAPHSADGRSWQQYGSRPVGATLTINPMTLYDAGRRPLVLLGIRQATPARGLMFRSELVTLTPGFARFSEYVSAGTPAGAFGLRANFSPLRGFVLNPDPQATMAGLSPTVVLTATATRAGMFHIGDWVVSYRIGSVRHTVRLVDDGVFCAGGRNCPSL